MVDIYTEKELEEQSASSRRWGKISGMLFGVPVGVAAGAALGYLFMTPTEVRLVPQPNGKQYIAVASQVETRVYMPIGHGKYERLVNVAEYAAMLENDAMKGTLEQKVAPAGVTGSAEPK